MSEQALKDAEFEKELATLINRHSRENVSNTPDFILAEYLHFCLKSFEAATLKRRAWYEPSQDLTDGLE